MPIVVSNLLCAVATFGTSEILNHVILLRRELYVPFETNGNVITAQKRKQTAVSARQGCCTHAQQHT